MLEKLKDLNLPKTIHYVWMGKDIDEKYLRTIFANKHLNPNYKTIIWTDRESSITNSLNLIKHENNGFVNDIESSQPHFEIKSVNELFSELQKSPLGTSFFQSTVIQINEQLISLQDKLHNVELRASDKKIIDDGLALLRKITYPVSSSDKEDLIKNLKPLYDLFKRVEPKVSSRLGGGLSKSNRQYDFKSLLDVNIADLNNNTIGQEATPLAKYPEELKQLLHYMDKLKKTSHITDATILESIFTREKKGTFRNYAAASDIARVGALYLYGGIYLDVDILIPGSFEILDNRVEIRGDKKDFFGMFGGYTLDGNKVELDAIDRVKNNHTIKRSNNNILGAMPSSEIALNQLRYFVNVYRHPDNVNVAWSLKRSVYANSALNKNSPLNRLGGTMMMTGPGSFDNKTVSFLHFPQAGSLLNYPDILDYTVDMTDFDGFKEYTNQIADQFAKTLENRIDYIGYIDEPDASATWAIKPSLITGIQLDEAPEKYTSLKNNIGVAKYIYDDAFNNLRDQYLRASQKFIDLPQEDLMRLAFLKGVKRDHASPVFIPGYAANMSLQELYRLGIDGEKNLNAEQHGILFAHIEKAEIESNKRYGNVLVRERGTNLIKEIAPTYKSLLPDSIFSKTGGLIQSTGYCYATTLATALALHESGRSGATRLSALYVVSDSNHERNNTLRAVLDTFNELANSWNRSKTLTESERIPKPLKQIIDILKDEPLAKLYELQTQKHAMLIGTLGEGSSRRYFFQDNVFQIEYADPRGLYSFLTQEYFTNQWYKMHDTSAKADFTFKFIHLSDERLAEVKKIAIQIGKNEWFDLSMLSNPEVDKESILKKIHGMKRISELEFQRIVKGAKYSHSLAKVEALDNLNSFGSAIGKLYTDHQLSHQFVPMLDSIAETDTPGMYRISFFDPNDPNTASNYKSITTWDKRLMKLKSFSNKYAPRKWSNNKGIEMPPGVFTTYFLVSIAIEHLLGKEHVSKDLTPTSENLITAFQMHYYVNCANAFSGFAQDVVFAGLWTHSKIVSNPAHLQKVIQATNTYIKLAKKAHLNVVPLEKIMPALFSKTNKVLVGIAGSKMITRGMPVLDLALGGISVGFSIYKLANAENILQKRLFGVQLAFDIAGVGLSAVATIAALAGGMGVACQLGGLGIPLAVLSTSVVRAINFYGFTESAVKENVVDTFSKIKDAYTKGYVYNDGVLEFLEGAVVKQIDLKRGIVEFGSQELCVRNPDNEREINSYDSRRNSLSLRNILFKKDDSLSINLDHRNGSVVILPNTPMSYISYNTANIEGINKWYFPIIDEMERNSEGRFQLESFYFTGFDNIIYKLFDQYVPTAIDVVLGSLNRVIIAPELPKTTAIVLDKVIGVLKASNQDGLEDESFNKHKQVALAHAITYNLIGEGGQYTIGLKERAEFNLVTQNEKGSRWVLDCNYLENDDLEIRDNGLIIGKVTINLDSKSTANDEIVVVKKNGHVCEINLATKKEKLIQVNQWQEDILRSYEAVAPYLAITNYEYKGLNVGNAFYEVSTKRVLFSLPNAAGRLEAVVDILDKLILSPSPKVAVYNRKAYTTLASRHGGVINFFTYKEIYSLEALDPIIGLASDLISKWKNGSHKCVTIEEANLYDKLDRWLQKYTALYEQLQNIARDKSVHRDVIFRESDDDTKILKGHEDADKFFGEHLANSLIELKDELKTLRYNASGGAMPYAQLGAVVGEDVYWYNVNMGLIWRTNAKDGKVKSQYVLYNKGDENKFLFPSNNEIFLPFWDLRNISFEQRDNRVYVSLSIDSENLSSKLTYDLGKDFMRLVFVGKDAISLPKTTLGGDYKGFKFKNDVNQKPIKMINPTESSLIFSYCKLSKKAFWISNGERIEPNVPVHALSEKLMLLHWNSQADIFYFYDPLEKTLYHQKRAVTAKQAKQVGSNIAEIQRIGSSLMLVSYDGLIQRVNDDGTLTVQAVKEQWLNNQGDSWLQKLSTLPTDEPIVIMGIKKSDKTNFISWYYKGLVIMAPKFAENMAIEFIDLDDSGSYAFLFDRETGKLYKQAVLDTATLVRILGPDYILIAPEKSSESLENIVKKASSLVKSFFSLIYAEELVPLSQSEILKKLNTAPQLLSSLSFATIAKQEPGVIRLISKDGVVLNMDRAGQVSLIGLTQNWINSHPDLTADINLLLHNSKWLHNDIIELYEKPNNEFTWYHVALGRRVALADLTAEDKPVYVGSTVATSGDFLLYVNSKKGTYELKYTKDSENVKSRLAAGYYAERHQKSVVVTGTDFNDELNPLSLKGVTGNVMSGGNGQDIYRLDLTKDPLDHIIISNFSDDKAVDALILNNSPADSIRIARAPKPSKNQLDESITDHDLLITQNGKLVVIKNMFGEDRADYNHMNLYVERGNSYQQFDMARMASQIEQYDQHVSRCGIYSLSYFGELQ